MQIKQKFWQTDKFKQLQKQWNEKLEESGFKDAEMSLRKGTIELRQIALNSYRKASQLDRECKLRYYELLGICFHSHVFNDPVERIIMERKAWGRTIKQIVQELKRLKLRPNHRETIGLIIERYEITWGIRKR